MVGEKRNAFGGWNYTPSPLTGYSPFAGGELLCGFTRCRQCRIFWMNGWRASWREGLGIPDIGIINASRVCHVMDRLDGGIVDCRLMIDDLGRMRL
jgi:hypothetical protein